LKDTDDDDDVTIFGRLFHLHADREGMVINSGQTRQLKVKSPDIYIPHLQGNQNITRLHSQFEVATQRN